MEVTLGYWAPNAQYARVYVNGLALPAGSKAYLERKGSGVAVKFQGDPGTLDADAVLTAVRTLVPGLVWDALVAAGQQERKRGAKPGSRASARADVVVEQRPWEVNQGSWTAEDAARLDPDLKTNKPERPITLLVDHREPAEMVDRLRAVTNLQVEVATLEVGDYAVPGKLLVERKTVADFVTSITALDKRLFHQSEALVRSDLPAVLLVEGDLYGQRRMSLEQLAGAMSFLAVIQRVSVIPTLTLEHSAYLVAKLARHADQGLGYDLGLRGTAPREPQAAAAFVLEGLPGLSATRAKALLKHFGSLAAVAAADESALRAVEGIGAKTARLIVETFRAGHA